MDAHLKEYLFSTGSLIAREKASTAAGPLTPRAAEVHWASAA
jgi:hypothetical protein